MPSGKPLAPKCRGNCVPLLLTLRGTVTTGQRWPELCGGRSCQHWRGAALLAISVALLFAPNAINAQDPTPVEYRIKANFLATFPSFIEWPENAFSSAQAPFVVCVVGDFRFGTALAESARHAPVLGRRIEIRWVRQNLQLRNCHILFISNSEANRYVKILQIVQGAGTLTVGETPGFLDLGGMLSFSYQKESLQFEVNLSAANKAHLRISSRLLVLARRVLGNPESSNGYITAQRTSRRVG